MKLIAVCLGILSANLAWAYIPPSQFIVKNMVQKRAGYKGIRIKSLVTLMEEGRPAGTRFKQTLLIDGQTGAIRSRALDDSGQELFVTNRTTSQSEMPLADLVLFSPESPSLIRALRAHGVEVMSEPELFQKNLPDATSLARLEKKICWVLGLESKGSTQLWVEKDTFLPARLIAQRDIRFEGFRYYQEVPIPKTILVYQTDGDGKSKLLMREEILEVQMGPDLSDLRAAATPGWTPAGDSADSGTKDLIKSFYQTVR